MMDPGPKIQRLENLRLIKTMGREPGVMDVRSRILLRS
jgi:hypothetical protein